MEEQAKRREAVEAEHAAGDARAAEQEAQVGAGRRCGGEGRGRCGGEGRGRWAGDEGRGREMGGDRGH